MRRTAWWCWAGAVMIAACMALAVAGVPFAAQNLTPLCWSGFILLADGALARRGASWLRRRPGELALMALISIPSWALFELYDRPRFWRADGPELWWHYSGLPPWPWRGLGYAWAFATITPAVLLLAQWLEPAVARVVGRGLGGRLPREVGWLLIPTGVVMAAIPLLWPSPAFAADVWLAWLLLLEPINRHHGWPSLLGDLEVGRRARPVALLASGLLCGLLWEGWNAMAASRWDYTVPFLGQVRLFAMPVLGFLGFLPFAVVVFDLYHFLRGLLPRATPSSPPGPASGW